MPRPTDNPLYCCQVTDFDVLRADDTDLGGLRDRIRSFLADDAAEFGWQPEVDCWLSRWDADFSIRLARAGFVGLTIPTDYGGHGLSFLHRYVVTEELLAAGAPVAAHWIADRQVAPALLTYGTEEQRRRLLPRIASGTLYSAIGMSEHGAGSDLAAVSTKATRTDGGWLLNGTKVWTSGAHLADQIVVLARTSPIDPDHRHSGFSQFIVPTSAPGVTIDPIIQMSGEHHFNEVLFDDVALTDADLLGTVGAGWHQVTSELGFERSGPERFLSTATLLFALVEALRDDPRADVGDLMARMISLRQLSISVARALTAGRDAAVSAALVKDLGTRFEQDSVEIAAELLDRYDGPDRPRLQAMLDTARVHAPLFTLRGGTNEVLRGIVAKNWTKQAAAEQHSDEYAELRELAEQIGRTAAPARTLPLTFDDALWRTAETSGLTRLSSDAEAGPAAAAVVLGTLARHAAAVPIAETDVLATWLATEAGLHMAHFVAESGPQLRGLRHQVDRQRWLGRNRASWSPRADMQAWQEGLDIGLAPGTPAGGDADDTELLDTGLDPMCALALRLVIAPGVPVRLTLATAACGDAGTLGAVIDKYRQPSHIERALLMSATLDGLRLSQWLGAERVESAGRSYPVTIDHLPARREERIGVHLARGVEQALEEIVTETIRLGGTVTGEHGVGLAKKAFVKRQLGEASYELMRSIKRALDPECLLNPGKIFDIN